VHDTTTFFLVTLPNIHRLKIPTDLAINISLVFSQGSVATYAGSGEILMTRLFKI